MSELEKEPVPEEIPSALAGDPVLREAVVSLESDHGLARVFAEDAVHLSGVVAQGVELRLDLAHLVALGADFGERRRAFLREEQLKLRAQRQQQTEGQNGNHRKLSLAQGMARRRRLPVLAGEWQNHGNSPFPYI